MAADARPLDSTMTDGELFDCTEHDLLHTVHDLRLCTRAPDLERLIGPGTFRAMTGRGGLRADVLEGGEVRVGDAIVLEPARAERTPARDVLS